MLQGSAPAGSNGFLKVCAQLTWTINISRQVSSILNIAIGFFLIFPKSYLPHIAVSTDWSFLIFIATDTYPKLYWFFFKRCNYFVSKSVKRSWGYGWKTWKAKCWFTIYTTRSLKQNANKLILIERFPKAIRTHFCITFK